MVRAFIVLCQLNGNLNRPLNDLRIRAEMCLVSCVLAFFECIASDVTAFLKLCHMNLFQTPQKTTIIGIYWWSEVRKMERIFGNTVFYYYLFIYCNCTGSFAHIVKYSHAN